MTNLVIIGSGMAAYTLAREYRKLEKDRVLYLITADDGCSYSKPTLSNALAKKQRPSSIAMASAEKMAQTLAAEIQPHTRVTAIDTANKKLQLDNGKTLAYGQLVLALGAEAIPASLEGNAAERVMSVNSLADYSRFHEALEQAHHVSVIGPGLIGCEFANDLAGAGKNVTVIGPGEAPLGRLLPSEAAQDLKQALTGLGCRMAPGSPDPVPGEQKWRPAARSESGPADHHGPGDFSHRPKTQHLTGEKNRALCGPRYCCGSPAPDQ